MPVDLRPRKAELRDAVLARRTALPVETVAADSAIIAQTICALPAFQRAATVCGYASFGNEVQTDAILQAALAQGKRLALPRTLLRERELMLHQVDSLEALIPGPYGIREPAPDAPVVDPAEVDLFVVPGSVFDSTGNRIGYGAGFYDSLLVLSEGWRVAAAYAFQLAPHVPAAEHDMPMDVIVTEKGIVDCGQAQRAGDRLRLRNMTFYGHHGAFPQEREHGIRLAIDVDLRLDLQTPGLTDDLTTTVNYPAVYRLIQRMQTGQQFALFESLAEQVARAILREFPIVSEVTVHARKFNPPIGGVMDAFEVEITRSQPGWAR